MTSFLPLSSGTQKRVDDVVRRLASRYTFVPTGMCSSVLVTTVRLSYHRLLRELELPPPLLAGDRRPAARSGPVGLLGEVEDRGDRRDGDDREDQRRDDRPADLERGVAVDLLRVVRLALAVAELEREEDGGAEHERSR